MDRKKEMTEEELIRMREQGKDDLIWRTYSHGASMRDVCFIAEADRERVYAAVVSGIVGRLISKAERMEISGIEQLGKLKARLDREMAELRHEEEAAVMKSREELIELNRKLEEMDRELEKSHRDFQEALNETMDAISCGGDPDDDSDAPDEYPEPAGEDPGMPDGDCGSEADAYAAGVPDSCQTPAEKKHGWSAFKDGCRRFFLSDLFSHICLGAGAAIIVAACTWGVASAVHDYRVEREVSRPVSEYRVLSDALDKALVERDGIIDGLNEIEGYVESLMELYGDGVEALSAKQAEISFIRSGIDRAIGSR